MMRRYSRPNGKWLVKFWGAAIAIGLLSNPAYASFTCKVQPASYLGVDSNGYIYVETDGVGILGICSVGASSDGANPEACKAWYSALLTWRENRKTGFLYFNPDQNAGATACTAFANWDVRRPYHLEAANQ